MTALPQNATIPGDDALLQHHLSECGKYAGLTGREWLQRQVEESSRAGSSWPFPCRRRRPLIGGQRSLFICQGSLFICQGSRFIRQGSRFIRQGSGQDTADDVPMYVGQPSLDAVVVEGQPFVIHAQ